MKIIIIILSSLLIIFQIKGRYTLRKLKKIGVQSIESYHSQWLGQSILWFVASGYFLLDYYYFKLNTYIGRIQLYLSLFYLLIAMTYVLRAFQKDIIGREYLWTSKRKIYWKDVRTYRFVEDKNPNHIYLEVESKGKVIVMKFLKKEQPQIQSLIDSVYEKFDFKI